MLMQVSEEGVTITPHHQKKFLLQWTKFSICGNGPNIMQVLFWQS